MFNQWAGCKSHPSFPHALKLILALMTCTSRAIKITQIK